MTVHFNRNFYYCSIYQLVTGGCQPDSRDIEGQAPLHKALLHNQADSVQALVLSGADLNILDDSGSTPLHVRICSKSLILYIKPHLPMYM